MARPGAFRVTTKKRFMLSETWGGTLLRKMDALTGACVRRARFVTLVVASSLAIGQVPSCCIHSQCLCYEHGPRDVVINPHQSSGRNMRQLWPILN